MQTYTVQVDVQASSADEAAILVSETMGDVATFVSDATRIFLEDLPEV